MDSISKEAIRKAWCVEIGDKIAKARNARQLSQAQLANMAEIPQSHLARIEKGDLNPTIGTIGLILSTIGMTIDIVSPKLSKN